MIYTILIIVQVAVALGLIVLILLQHGKGADAGAAFGSGASGTVFGAKGTANFMSRATAGLATVFMLISLALAYLVNGAGASGGGSVTDQLTHEPKKGAPTSSVVHTEHKKKSEATPVQPQPHKSADHAGDKSNRNDQGPKVPD